jgi:hypothetical protein
VAERPAPHLRVVESPPKLHLVPERICSNCVHAALGPFGVHCILFGEDIWRETVAEECGEWEPT